MMQPESNPPASTSAITATNLMCMVFLSSITVLVAVRRRRRIPALLPPLMLLPAPMLRPALILLLVLTLPVPAAEIAFQNKRVVYAILFRAAAEAMRDIAADPRHLGAEIGAVAVLHSWGQAMTYHPHLHCIVPAGGLSLDQT